MAETSAGIRIEQETWEHGALTHMYLDIWTV